MVSGALLENFWWGSIFLINVFVVVVTLVASYFLIPSSHEKLHAPLDPFGALLSIVGLSALDSSNGRSPGSPIAASPSG